VTEALGSVPGAYDLASSTETLITRENAPSARFSLLSDIVISRGEKADWDLLKHLHYKESSLPMGPVFWKASLNGETIGVLVTSPPKGMLRERHMAFPNIAPKGGDTRIVNQQRYRWINANIRVISRFVIDTMYRGIGAGYRMMNLVSRMEGMTYMEIQSSMSKFNFFGQRAGFRFVKPLNANMYDKGLKFLRSHFEASPQDFEAIVMEIMSKTEAEQQMLLEACKEFYFRHSALENTGAVRDRTEQRWASMTIRGAVKAIQQMCLASPMYGVYKNPDAGREIPKMLPLAAFDWQATNEPLRVDLL